MITPNVSVINSNATKTIRRKTRIMNPIVREKIFENATSAQTDMSKTFLGTEYSIFFQGSNKDFKTLPTEKKKIQKLV